MSDSIEQLSIDIETKVKSKKLNDLADALENLGTKLNNIDTTKIQGLVSSLSNLADSFNDVKTASRSISSVQKELNKIKSSKNAFASPRKEVEELADKAEKASKNTNNLSESLANSENAHSLSDTTNSLEKVSEIAKRSAERFSVLRNILAGLKITVPTDGLKKANNDIESLQSKINALKSNINNKKANIDVVDNSEIEKDEKELEALRNKLQKLLLAKEQLESHGGFRFNIEGLEAVGNKLKSVGKRLTSFIRNATSFKSIVGLLSKGTDRFSASNSKLAKNLVRTTKMLGLMIKRMILRKLITNVTDGFNNLAQGSARFNASLSLLWNSFRQLGNSIAASVSPLINALAPALNYIIQLCIKAVDAINQLISALTGASTWTKAKTLSDDYGKSLAGAGKSAKELKKTVLGFDELNQMQDNKDSGGGGLTDPSNMFEENKISDKWKEFSDKLKKMWKDADFTELGTILGTKIRDALNKIPWDRIRRTANNIGKSIATLINGGVEVVDLGKTIGRTIAQSLNTAFEFINGFVENLHWANVGFFIADEFNGFFENIDWELIKTTIIDGFKGLAKSINSFVANFHWDNISNTISNLVNSLSTAITEFVDDVKWGELGSRLGEQLSGTIKKIDWEKLGNLIGELLQGAVDFAVNFLKSVEFTEAIKALSDVLKGIFDGLDVDGVALVCGAIIGKILIKAGALSLLAKGVKTLGTSLLSKIFGGSEITVVSQKIGETVGKSFESVPANTYISKIAAFGSAIAVAFGSVLATSFAMDKIFSSDWFTNFAESMGNSAEKVQDFADRYEGLGGKITMFRDEFYGLRMIFNDMPKSISSAVTSTEAYNNAISETKKGTKLTNEQLDLMQKAYGLTDGQINNVKKTMVESQNETSLFADKVKILTDKGYSMAEACDIVKGNMDFVSESQETLSRKLVTGREKLEDYTSKTETADSRLKEIKISAEKFAEKADSAKEKTERFSGALADVSEKMGDYSSKSSDVENATEGIGGGFDRLKEKISKVAEKFADFIQSLKTASSTGFNINVGASGAIGGFATGGFPEDGTFRASHGELMGRFDNGQTVVANNMQIIDGISAGVADGMMSALMSMNAGSTGGGETHIHVHFGNEELGVATYKAQKQASRLGLIPKMV